VRFSAVCLRHGWRSGLEGGSPSSFRCSCVSSWRLQPFISRIFPTRLRATGTGFSYNVARYIAAIAPWTFGTLRALYGIQWAATIISLVFLLGFVVLRYAPETKGKPLPE
jgi:hypothetical protein